MGLQSDDPSELITIDKDYLDRVTLRGVLIRKHNRTVHGYVPGGEDAVAELYTYLLNDYLPCRFPSIFKLSGGGKMLENLVTGRSFPTTPPKDPLAGLRILGTTVEEDLFLMKNTSEGHKTVAFICCFPSGFNPSHKLGKGLKAIHEPVPSFEKIGLSMERFFGKVEVGKNVRRVNWSIQTHPDLFDCDRNHMKAGTQENTNTKVDLDQTFARMELQTLSRLPETQSLLFSFKTYVYPIREIKEEGSGPAVADAIQGLKAGNAPGMWVYKGGIRWAGKCCGMLSRCTSFLSFEVVPLRGSGLSLGGPLLGQAAQLLGGGAEAPGVSALDHLLAVDGDLLALLEEHEGGHGGDAVAAGDVADVVDVDLGKGQLARVAVLAGEVGEDGGDGLAGGAPVGEEVDGDVGGAGEELVELRGRGDVLDLVVGHGGDGRAFVAGERGGDVCRKPTSAQEMMLD
ncbi:hypothetical protein HJFPF1_06010 [Paramyrothecium foliicola]|nr:hypothetical protein HJFPF1_06010 [Paramyrothecium foliicola]